MRLLDDTGLALDCLEALMEPGTGESIRLKASTEVLDRAGIRGGFEIDLGVGTTANPMEMLTERLTQLRERGQKAQEAETGDQNVVMGELVAAEDTVQQETLFDA